MYVQAGNVQEINIQAEHVKNFDIVDDVIVVGKGNKDNQVHESIK